MPFLISSHAPPTPLTTGEVAELTIRLVTLADQPSRNAQEIIPRLTVDSVEVGLRRAAWQKGRGAIGINCGFTLAKIADRSLITDDSSITFEIGTKAGLAAVEWKTIASLQKLSQRSFQMAGDTFAFQSISGVSDKLNRSPATPFIMYDPDKVPFNADEVETLQDAEGREYPVEALEVTGLTLHTALEEIFVNRCGFTSFDPNNVPDLPIPQVACDMTQTFLDAVWPYIEPFGSPNGEGPLLTEENGVLTIHDMSHVLPDGFPAPPDLTVFGCEEVSVDASYSDAVAAKMAFTVPDTGWDYATSRIRVSNLPIGNDEFTGDILFRLLVTNTFELRSFHQPNVILDEREQFYWEYVSTILGVSVSQENVTKFYDKYARELTSIAESWIREPGEVDVNIFGDPTERAVQYTGYAQHPTRIGRQYQSSISRHVTGKVSVDSANPYRGAPFKQALKLAHWAGNADEGTTVETGTLRTVEQQFKPQRNGQVTRKVMDYDNVRNLPLANRNEQAVGDLSLSGFGSRSREMLVTEDGSEYTSGRVVSIAVGPVPIEHAVPLVRRKLKRMRERPQEAVLNIIGFNPQIEAGLGFTVSDKLEEIEGSFVCVGYSGECTVENNGATTCKMSVEAIEI